MGRLGGRSKIRRPVVAQVPAGDITLNAAMAFLITRERTMAIDIKNLAAGNIVRLYDKFPWEPAILDPDKSDSPLLPANGGDPSAAEVLVAALGTDYRTIDPGEVFHFEHYELNQLWLMAEGGTQVVEITLAHGH